MKCAVLGDPIAHSLSPALHRAGYVALGLDWSYDAVRVPSGSLGTHLRSLDEDWRGLSLTMPLKREAMSLADRVSDRAALVGAANTLVLVDGQVHADNTDLPGVLAALRERWTARSQPRRSSAPGPRPRPRAGPVRRRSRRGHVAGALSRARRRTVAAIERDLPARRCGGLAGGGHPCRRGAGQHDPCRGAVPGPRRALRPDPRGFDVLYDPWPTPLSASADGRVLVSGLDLLVHQAAYQFEIFTGSSAPVADMRAAGESALAARQ